MAGVVKSAVREEWTAPAEGGVVRPVREDRDYQAGSGSERGYLSLVARAACDAIDRCDAAAAALAPSIVSAVRSLDRNLPISEVQTMSAVVAGATAEMRSYLVLLAAFAAIAVLLASVGICGVMSFTVARRTHEIGIRVALGAPPSSVLRMIVRQGMAVALGGAAVGTGAALLLTRFMRGVLFGVAPRDALTFGVGLVVLSAVALLASYVPARRATGADALVALRAD
ncbi:MAG TPA: FtsX-like permease family protein [Gemmatimonadaceae bacterium]|nr:FtsX-like permease family protein [Gemmatimonadaceae bacterium]